VGSGPELVQSALHGLRERGEPVGRRSAVSAVAPAVVASAVTLPLISDVPCAASLTLACSRASAEVRSTTTPTTAALVRTSIVTVAATMRRRTVTVGTGAPI
jgi:hypothetical protein